MKTFVLFALLLPVLFQTACTKKAPVPVAVNLPAFATMDFTDQNGEPFAVKDLKGQNVLVSFIYTKCPVPEACPLTIHLNKRIYEHWAQEGKKLPLHFLLVTLDPATDKPEVLKKYAAQHQLDPKSFTLVTGDEQKLSDFASQLANVVGLPSAGFVSHNVKSVLLDPNLNTIKEFKDNEWKPEEVVGALQPAKS